MMYWERIVLCVVHFYFKLNLIHLVYGWPANYVMLHFITKLYIFPLACTSNEWASERKRERDIEKASDEQIDGIPELYDEKCHYFCLAMNWSGKSITDIETTTNNATISFHHEWISIFDKAIHFFFIVVYDALENCHSLSLLLFIMSW